ncbi:alkaline phosphatase family protein [Tistrella bauzanensis]
MRFVLIGLDGLRPELVTPARMPALSRLMAEGCVLGRQSASFPTETYVNLPTLVTGARPSGHGMVANFFLDPGSMPASGSRVSTSPRSRRRPPPMTAGCTPHPPSARCWRRMAGG